MVWPNVAYIVGYHIFAGFGLYNYFFNASGWKMYLWFFIGYLWCGLGVTAGMHRLWSHKSYTPSKGLEVFLAIGATMAFQNSIWEWCRDHRVHHKYSETEADPHNSHRGIFFAHVGWLMVRKNPAVKKMGESMDLSDLQENPIIQFQHKYYSGLMILLTIIIPTLGPVYLWDENLWTSFTICCWRIAVVHHCTWFVNSISHWQGPHPYDNTIYPAENMITGMLAFGEGWHNFHHRFPSDYRCSDKEFGVLKPLFNLTAFFLDGVARYGFVSNQVVMSEKLVNSSIQQYGNDDQDARQLF